MASRIGLDSLATIVGGSSRHYLQTFYTTSSALKLRNDERNRHLVERSVSYFDQSDMRTVLNHPFGYVHRIAMNALSNEVNRRAQHQIAQIHVDIDTLFPHLRLLLEESEKSTDDLEIDITNLRNEMLTEKDSIAAEVEIDKMNLEKVQEADQKAKEMQPKVTKQGEEAQAQNQTLQTIVAALKKRKEVLYVIASAVGLAALGYHYFTKDKSAPTHEPKKG